MGVAGPGDLQPSHGLPSAHLPGQLQPRNDLENSRNQHFLSVLCIEVRARAGQQPSCACEALLPPACLTGKDAPVHCHVSPAAGPWGGRCSWPCLVQL